MKKVPFELTFGLSTLGYEIDLANIDNARMPLDHIGIFSAHLSKGIEDIKKVIVKIPSYTDYLPNIARAGIKLHNKNFINLLVSFGLDLNVNSGELLQYAIKNCATNFVKELVELGCDPTLNNSIVLKMALDIDRVDLSKYFISLGLKIAVEPNDKILCKYIMMKDTEIVDYLVSCGSDINVVSIGGTIFGCLSYDINALKVYTPYIPNIDTISRIFISAPIVKGKWHVTRYLMQHGLNINKYAPEIQRFINEQSKDQDNLDPTASVEDDLKYFIEQGLWYEELDPLKYISILNEKHLGKITDPDISRIILSKKRSFDRYDHTLSDLVILISQN